MNAFQPERGFVQKFSWLVAHLRFHVVGNTGNSVIIMRFPGIDRGLRERGAATRLKVLDSRFGSGRFLFLSHRSDEAQSPDQTAIHKLVFPT